LADRHNVDFVALSFVRRSDDIETLRKELVKFEVNCKIIAKIEHPDAVENFAEVLDAADGVMVARGDLGIEYPMEEVPGLQKMMVRRCREEGKPVIVATQMLESMITNPRPTRAEVSDVANAVYDSADAIMLSGESASGAYPVRAVQTMAKIASKVEETMELPEVNIDWTQGGQTAAVTASAYKLMEFGYRGVCDLKAFVVLTETGKTAEYLSRMRPSLPIIALTGDMSTADQLKLNWGVEPRLYNFTKQESVDVRQVIKQVRDLDMVKQGDKIIMIYGEIWGEPGLTSVVP
jgi:pyruvate kinase